MFNLQQKAETENRASEAKVWSVLVAQVWAGLAGYCHAPVDLKEVSTLLSRQIPTDQLYRCLTPRRSAPRSLSFSPSCSMVNQNYVPPFLKR